jgi:WD40 repeat protein
MADGHLLGKLDPHNLGPVNVLFSADGQRAFTCGGDGSTMMWDIHTLKKQMEFRGNDQQAVNGADISPDGRRVVTASQSGSWQLWDAATGVQLLDVHASTGPLISALFSPSGREIYTCGDGQVRIWRSLTADPTIRIPIDASFLKGLRR